MFQSPVIRVLFATIISLLLITVSWGAFIIIVSPQSSKTDIKLLDKSLFIRNTSIQNTQLEGNNIILSLTLYSTYYSLSLRAIELNLTKNGKSLVSNFSINFHLQKDKNTTVQYNIPRGFSDASNHKFMLIDKGNYTLNSIALRYNSTSVYTSKAFLIGSSFNIIGEPISQMQRGSLWTAEQIDLSTGKRISNFFLTMKESSIKINADFNSTFILRSQINLTSVNFVKLSSSGKSPTNFFINGSSAVVTLNSSSSANVAQFSNTTKFEVVFNLEKGESLTISILVPKQLIVLYYGIADDHWETNFENPLITMNLVNKYFKEWFNIKFVFSIKINFVSPSTTNLPTMMLSAAKQFGEALGLMNNTWDIGPGKRKGNLGLDFLLIISNKTMSNYGMVLGDRNAGYNMASNVGGSLNARGFRLAQDWADNLFQHEISHMFNAPDRYTGQDPPSIMTKSSTPEQVVSDISAGTSWLQINNWLPQDLVTMANAIKEFQTYQN